MHQQSGSQFWVCTQPSLTHSALHPAMILMLHVLLRSSILILTTAKRRVSQLVLRVGWVQHSLESKEQAKVDSAHRMKLISRTFLAVYPAYRSGII